METVAAGMEKRKVIKLLEFFSEIDGKINAYRTILAELEDYYNPALSVNYDGMPKGKNHISNQTERTATKIPDYAKGEIILYKEKIRELQKVKVEILKEVSRLKLQQKNVIFGFYFQKMKWEQVAERTHYSERQCKNIRNAAVEKLLQEFGKNKILTEYKIRT